MKTIWKYPLLIMDSQTVTVTEGAEFLSVIEQYGNPTLYALVDPASPLESTEVLIRGTGQQIDEALLVSHVFIGTLKTFGGSLVWHIFVERKNVRCK